MKARGAKTYIPDAKPKVPKRDAAREKRQRMLSYGRRVTGSYPLDFGLKKKDISENKVDYDDIKNIPMNNEISAVGKLAAYKQNLIQLEARAASEYLDWAFKDMKKLREINRAQERAV